MGNRKWNKVPGYVGIRTRVSRQKTRIKGKVEPDLSFYARYKKDGKEVTTYLGRKSDGMTPAQAANIRAKLTSGTPVKLPKPRTGKTRPIKSVANMGDGSSDDYVDPENRPPEFWTFDRLFEQYVESQGGPGSYANYSTDLGYYKNHVRQHVGHLRPEEITAFKIQTIRNTISKKKVILWGSKQALDAAKRNQAKAIAAKKKERKKAAKIRHQLKADKAAARIIEIEKKIKANKRKLAPSTVERCIEMIRRLSNFGAENDLCPGPRKRIKMKRVDNERTEDLTPEQIAALLKACDEDSNQDVADMIRLALTTGLRRGSLQKLAWKHVNFQKNIITIKSIETRGRHSKGGKQIKLPLNSAAKQILETRAAVADLTFSPYVFPGLDGGMRHDTGKAAKRIVRAAGLPDDFRPLHGQRHAFASNLANTGQVDLYQIGKLLAHSPNSPTMTQRYSHIRDEALKKASDLMSDIVSNARAASKSPKDDQKVG
jgi:integrase